MAEISPKSDEIWGSAGTARKAATKAYDDLVKELAKDPLDSDKVVKHAGTMWVQSLKFAADLWLAPGKVATEVQKP